MEVLLVRHGESEGNALGRMQGRVDSPLTDTGRAQARRLAGWLKAQGFGWAAAYASPLSRAFETAEILAAETGLPRPEVDEDLQEVAAGSLEGLDREAISQRYPDFLTRGISGLGDFSAYGGESYEAVQERVQRLLDRLARRHRDTGQRALVVAHGGINFQLAKAALCTPVPRVCVLHWGNCTAALLRFRERRGVFFGELGWLVPLELMGGASHDGTRALFR